MADGRNASVTRFSLPKGAQNLYSARNRGRRVAYLGKCRLKSRDSPLFSRFRRAFWTRILGRPSRLVSIKLSLSASEAHSPFILTLLLSSPRLPSVLYVTLDWPTRGDLLPQFHYGDNISLLPRLLSGNIVRLIWLTWVIQKYFFLLLKIK